MCIAARPLRSIAGAAVNVVVTGASRGLGLGFVQHYLRNGHRTWACFRQEPGGLSELSDDLLSLVQWDVRQATPHDDAGLPDRVDLLINNAGIYGPGKGGQSLDRVTPQAMLRVFDVDCVGALRVVQFLKGQLIAARGVVANVSSKMGSSGDNTSGGSYAYRAAKAALAITSKSMAIDLGGLGVRVITLHPGWVRTDMTERSGLIDVAESVAGMAEVIGRVDDYAPGSFIAFDGKSVPF